MGLIENSFIKSNILLARDEVYKSIDYEDDINLIVNKYIQFDPIYISLQTTFLSIENNQSSEYLIDNFTSFSSYHSESEFQSDNDNNLFFTEILDQTKSFEILTLVFQTIKGIRDHCVRKLQNWINPILKLLIKFNINSWVLPANLHRSLFLQIMNDFPYDEILLYGNEYTFLDLKWKENFRFIYDPETGIIEIINKTPKLLN